MSGHRYFEAEPTSGGVPRDDRIGIVVGDAPRRDEAIGTTTHSIRFPALIVAEWVKDPEAFAREVAEVLNENAGRFFESARPELWRPADDPDWCEKGDDALTVLRETGADWLTPTALARMSDGAEKWFVMIPVGDAAGELDGEELVRFDTEEEANRYVADYPREEG